VFRRRSHHKVDHEVLLQGQVQLLPPCNCVCAFNAAVERSSMLANKFACRNVPTAVHLLDTAACAFGFVRLGLFGSVRVLLIVECL